MGATRFGQILVLVGILMVHGTAWAQDLPAFEVASVTENRSGGMTQLSPGLQPRFPGGPVTPAPGQILITNATLRDVIVLAYGLNPKVATSLLQGGSSRILNTRFNIAAKPPDGAPGNQTLLMLRTLLSDRFGLRTHVEMREVPAYVMTLAATGKLGPQLKPSSADCTAPSMPEGVADRARVGPHDAKGRPLCPAMWYEVDRPGGDWTIRYVSPVSFMLNLVQGFIDRPVVDASGLLGSFEWSVTFSPTVSISSESDRGGSSMITALREQLGMKLDARSHPMDVLVIDAVAMPTPN